MPHFDKQWLNRVKKALLELDDSFEKQSLLDEIEMLEESHGIIKSLSFSKRLCERLEKTIGKDAMKSVLQNCSCHYPEEDLQELIQCYEETKSIEQVHALMTKQTELALLAVNGLSQKQLEIVQVNKWGLAGELKGNTILVTKVPSEFDAHFEAVDEQLKAAYYCGCARIKEGLKFGFDLPASYCECGAGFFSHLWREILKEEVEVEQVQSILKGDYVCQFLIKLPL